VLFYDDLERRMDRASSISSHGGGFLLTTTTSLGNLGLPNNGQQSPPPSDAKSMGSMATESLAGTVSSRVEEVRE
jgi:hypothetical protein